MYIGHNFQQVFTHVKTPVVGKHFDEWSTEAGLNFFIVGFALVFIRKFLSLKIIILTIW
jgi:hypothetical protein